MSIPVVTDINILGFMTEASVPYVVERSWGCHLGLPTQNSFVCVRTNKRGSDSKKDGDCTIENSRTKLEKWLCLEQATSLLAMVSS
jgi:hypothetical protein